MIVNDVLMFGLNLDFYTELQSMIRGDLIEEHQMQGRLGLNPGQRKITLTTKSPNLAKQKLATRELNKKKSLS